MSSSVPILPFLPPTNFPSTAKMVPFWRRFSFLDPKNLPVFKKEEGKDTNFLDRLLQLSFEIKILVISYVSDDQKKALALSSKAFCVLVYEANVVERIEEIKWWRRVLNATQLLAREKITQSQDCECSQVVAQIDEPMRRSLLEIKTQEREDMERDLQIWTLKFRAFLGLLLYRFLTKEDQDGAISTPDQSLKSLYYHLSGHRLVGTFRKQVESVMVVFFNAIPTVIIKEKRLGASQQIFLQKEVERCVKDGDFDLAARFDLELGGPNRVELVKNYINSLSVYLKNLPFLPNAATVKKVFQEALSQVSLLGSLSQTHMGLDQYAKLVLIYILLHKEFWQEALCVIKEIKDPLLQAHVHEFFVRRCHVTFINRLVNTLPLVAFSVPQYDPILRTCTQLKPWLCFMKVQAKNNADTRYPEDVYGVFDSRSSHSARYETIFEQHRSKNLKEIQQFLLSIFPEGVPEWFFQKMHQEAQRHLDQEMFTEAEILAYFLKAIELGKNVENRGKNVADRIFQRILLVNPFERNPGTLLECMRDPALKIHAASVFYGDQSSHQPERGRFERKSAKIYDVVVALRKNVEQILDESVRLRAREELYHVMYSMSDCVRGKENADFNAWMKEYLKVIEGSICSLMLTDPESAFTTAACLMTRLLEYHNYDDFLQQYIPIFKSLNTGKVKEMKRMIYAFLFSLLGEDFFENLLPNSSVFSAEFEKIHQELMAYAHLKKQGSSLVEIMEKEKMLLNFFSSEMESCQRSLACFLVLKTAVNARHWEEVEGFLKKMETGECLAASLWCVEHLKIQVPSPDVQQYKEGYDKISEWILIVKSKIEREKFAYLYDIFPLAKALFSSYLLLSLDLLAFANIHRRGSGACALGEWMLSGSPSSEFLHLDCKEKYDFSSLSYDTQKKMFEVLKDDSKMSIQSHGLYLNLKQWLTGYPSITQVSAIPVKKISQTE